MVVPLARAHGLAGPVARPLPEALAGFLLDLGPDLGGVAACRGMAPTFDDEVPGETAAERVARHHEAVGVCTTCPVNRACAAARHQLGRDAGGVWAGHSSGGGHITYRPRGAA